jgi:hypothetical protein
MRTHFLLISMAAALVAAVGCSSSSNNGTTGDTDAGDSGLPDATSNDDAGDSGTPDGTTAETGAGDAGDAGDTGVPDASGPAFCDPTRIDAGTSDASAAADAQVPINHRAAPACCTSQRGPGPATQPYSQGTASPLAPDAGGCTSDADCKSGVNGRCFPFEGEVGSGGCSYDECFTDSECGAGATCACRTSPTDNGANVCQPKGNCVTDADCGPGGYCSPSLSDCHAQPTYDCHTASDTCVNDIDCAGMPADAGSCETIKSCVFGGVAGPHWACSATTCCLP